MAIINKERNYQKLKERILMTKSQRKTKVKVSSIKQCYLIV